MHRQLTMSATTVSIYTPPPWPVIAVLFEKSLSAMLPSCGQHMHRLSVVVIVRLLIGVGEGRCHVTAAPSFQHAEAG